MGYLIEDTFFTWERERHFSRKTKTKLWKAWPISLWCLKGSQMHTYIYTVYIYILYIYKIFLQAWVCSFSNTTKSKFHTITSVFISTVIRLFIRDLISFLSLHKILITATEQLIGQLFENRSNFHIRVLNKLETFWGYENLLEFGTWTLVECWYILIYHANYT